MPNLLRSGKGMAEKACHTFASTTQVGLTQALGCIETSAARPQLIYSTTTDSPDAAAFQAPPLSPCLLAPALYSRRREIGRASSRERWGQSGCISVVPVSLKQKNSKKIT